MASNVAVIKNVGTPMSFIRVIVLGASLVCSVLKTMCPVSDACTAISAVSRSRISPDQNLVGILPQDAAQAVGERVADLRVDRDLHDPFHVVLDRIFRRDQLVFDRVELIQGASRAWSSCPNRSGR